MRFSSIHLVLLSCFAGAACTPKSDVREPVALPAQPVATATQRSAEEIAVLTAVQRFFDTMTARDSAGSRAVLDSEGDFVSVRWNADGEAVVRRAPNAEYLANMPKATDKYLERMWDAEVRIHGPIATVWTPYDFHVNGAFSHCGIDAFHLRKSDADWIIASGTYTVERTGCAPSPLGAPAP
jgi:hypothetical protein